MLEGNVREVVGLFGLSVLNRGRPDGPMLDLVTGAGLGVLDLRDELPALDILEALDLLGEAHTEACLEDAPGLRALIDVAGVLIARGVIDEGVAVVLAADDLQFEGDLRTVGFGLLDGEHLEPLIAGLDELLLHELYFSH